MKKKHRVLLENENVIVFPGMVESLIADGIAYAEENNYIKAVKHFEEAKKYVELDDMVLSIYVLTLLETRRTQEAKEICERLLEEKSPVFEQIVELYLTILLDLKEYKELHLVINRFLREYQFSEERINNFNQLKELSIRLAAEHEEFPEVEDFLIADIEKDKLELEFFSNLHFIEQEQYLQQAFYKNINDAIPEIKAIAESKLISPTIRTLALLLLGSAGVTEEVTIEKFGFVETINPTVPPANSAVDRIETINRFIQNLLEKDPSKLAMTSELVHRHAYALFPFDWRGYNDEEVALAYIHFIETLFGESDLRTSSLVDLIKLVEDSLEVIDNE